ncbi:MAG: amidohydrolase [Gammaproteobacteria bacterium]|nr:amidohydrolase [Gammaproteobacteria bacterium]MBV9621414.1 amidohydrolase [Gammaproteobacteria bacterium]
MKSVVLQGWFLCAASLAAPAVSHADTARGDAADVVLLHGRIHTQDPQRRVVEALAIRGDTVVAAGSDAEMQRWVGPKTRTRDLHGHVVLPGLIDAHVHPAESAQDLGKCSLQDRMLDPAGLRSEVKRCLARESTPRSPWVEVVGVNVSQLTLTRRQLDDLLSDRPLLLEDASGHTLFANSAALAAAHIDANTPDPVGGHIERDRDGIPTGTLRDAAGDQVLAARPSRGLAYETAQLAKAFDGMRAVGITSVQDANVDAHDMVLYKRLYDAHRLRMRVRGTFGLKDTDRPAAVLIGEAIEFRRRWAVDPQQLRADAVKIFADGVIENPSRTAALLQPYLDESGRPTDERGPTYYSQPHLNEVVAAADAADLTVHIHAIGDRAVRSALDAFAYARQQNGVRDNRHQIAHLELIDPQDFPRFHELGVIANFQLLWAENDPYIVSATTPYLGPERSRHLYPARSLLDAGALIVGGSDWGVSSYNPFEAMEHAITRAEARGQQPLLPEQSVPLQVMVDAYTINAAFALKQERLTGSLEAGKRADLIVLDRDVFVLDPFELHETRVLETYLDGHAVYTAGAPQATRVR